MVISVASGKGGTGKTLVAVNLALSLAREGREVQLIDCDVEEPNDHLFLTPEMHASERVEMAVPRVDPESCDFCRACVDFCAYHALALAGGHIMVFDELCHACGGCSLLCPQKAIREEPVPIGRIESGLAKARESRGKDIRFVHGILDIGEPKATPIIRRLKQECDPEAINILDGGPGTGCPVMETVRGCDYCVLVTEPTQFGLHDLRMALDMARELGLPYGVVINKYVLGGGGMDIWCAENEIPVLLRIPYKREYASLYSRGLNLVEELPAWNERFLRIYREIEASMAARKVGI